MRHLHFDAIGGVAGDMVVAALLDAVPDHADACLRAAEAVAGVPCRLLRHRDACLAGARLWVAEAEGHSHTNWSDIRARLLLAELPDRARRHALGIFSELAAAEARVHGIAPDAVAFHEVGAADSIADIVAAGWLIAAHADADGADTTVSVGPLPLGGGRVRTAHGWLPVPAPATALLLEGFAMIDDGVAGERVTPTGAAILRHLAANSPAPAGPRTLRASGIGFGTRTLPGLSNVLRVLVSDDAVATPPGQLFRQLAVVEFEVDDQTPEDLATALDHIRRVAGVRDVQQLPAFGKKGRLVAHIQVLADPDALEAAVAACFAETSTIGLRTRISDSRILARSEHVTVEGEHEIRLKRVDRPGGATVKAESDDLAGISTYAERRRVRDAAERGGDS
jgi:uncharacterized protein (TIGR00299 family) protein